MPYVAKLFREVTGRNLQGLSHFTGWIGVGGYYHWRVVQQGLDHHVPHLAGQPAPRTPDARPSGKPLPASPSSTEAPSTGASSQQPGRSQPAPSGPTPGQSGTAVVPKQSGKTSTPHQGDRPASPGKNKPTRATEGPSNRPQGQGGAGDSASMDWYQMYMHETQGRITEPPGPPYPVGMAEERKEAIRNIYDQMARKEPPRHNIASRALRAYYTRVDPQTLDSWACQILCMIAEYHMACVTRGSVVTSPLLPRELADRLAPLADYASPEDQTGATDVRIRNNWARTLRVAVWLHRLDMALRQEPGLSRTIVRSRHCRGDRLAYFLSPGTTWELQFEDVVTQVLKEN